MENKILIRSVIKDTQTNMIVYLQCHLTGKLLLLVQQCEAWMWCSADHDSPRCTKRSGPPSAASAPTLL